MNIRTYTEQVSIVANSRLALPREANAKMDVWNKLAHMFHAKVTYIPGIERPAGLLGIYMQTLTVTIEGDYDDPKCQQLFDALYSNDPKKMEQIKEKLRFGKLTDEASNLTNAEDQSLAKNTQKYTAPQNRTIAVNSADTAPLVKRIFMFLEDGEWERVNEYCETVLDLDPENAHAYLGMLMADLKVNRVKDLKDQAESFDDNKNYQKAVRYANEKLKAGLIGCINHINTRNENERLEGLYVCALQELDAASNSEKIISELSIKKIAEQFEAISHYKDAAAKARECYEKIDNIRQEKKRKEEIARIEGERREREQRIAKKKAIKACMIAAPIVALVIAVALLITNVIVPNNRYKDAGVLIDAGKYEDAIKLLEMLDGYKNSSDLISSVSYMRAKELMEAGRNSEAAIAFYRAGKYQDAKEMAVQLDEQLYKSGIWQSVCATSHHIVGLKSDGTVVAQRFSSDGVNEYGQCNVSDWTDIVSISASGSHTVGLKSDGTVVATKYIGKNYNGECEVSDWTDIVSISAGGSHTVGLKSDGTVVATKYIGNYYNGECEVSDWTDIVAVSAGMNHTIGLRRDGTVVATECIEDDVRCWLYDISNWTDIVAISISPYHAVGLKSDGTVVAVGSNGDGQCNVSDWTDIVAISVGDSHTVGLKSNGTVISTEYTGMGSFYYGYCEVSDWTNIVGCFADGFHTVGLKEDGTIVITNCYHKHHDEHDVSMWNDIRVP